MSSTPILLTPFFFVYFYFYFFSFSFSFSFFFFFFFSFSFFFFPGTRLRSTGGTATTRLDIISLLQPNLDPLRPNRATRSTTTKPSSPPSIYPYPNDPIPAVLGRNSITDEVGGYDFLSPFPLGEAQPMGKLGVVDVTKPPFNADPSGERDSTDALQHAVDFAKRHYYIVYVPRGEYMITKTIMGISTTRMLTTGYVPGMLKNGFTRDFLLDGVSSRYVPMYLHAEKGAVLKVPANTPYFSNVTQPKAVIDFRFVNPLSEYEPNENYNTIISGLSIIVEAGGNQGAIGVRLRGAQELGAALRSEMTLASWERAHDRMQRLR